MEPDFPVAGIDFEKANAARMYDYWLGGGHHFAVDREQAARIEAGNPAMVHAARSNRAFLGRVVRWAVAQGIDQFLDLGSGVPTVGNVHEIA
jgi:S-adenosyl methyltransferase